MFKFIMLFFFSIFTFVKGQCVDINNPSSQGILNVSYNQDCYLHTTQYSECCDYFLLDQNCIDKYIECDTYQNHIINDLQDECSHYNETVLNISYSNKCHKFTLQLQTSCCDNIIQPDCIDWYTQCNTFNTSFNEQCELPTKYRNQYCVNYTKHIDNSCCNTFIDLCDEIYEWCVANNPQSVSVLDLFVGPYDGHTIGTNIIYYENISTIEDCAQLCLDTSICKSFDYIINTKRCNLNNHRVGDNDEIHLINDEHHNSKHYEKILNMPYHDRNCNVKHVHWLDDGICDKRGGYNTEQCHYDGGDCCAKTCNLDNHFPFCGIIGYNCIDPSVINNQSISPTFSPTILPTKFPTTTPSKSPSNSPTSFPSKFPTGSPTISPNNSPTKTPTSSPNNSPTKTPTFSPSNSPTKTPTSSPSNSPTKTPTTSPSNSPNTPFPSESPTNKKIISKSESSDDDDLKFKNTVIGLSCLIVFMAIVIIYLLFKNINFRNQINNFSTRTQTSIINPVYDSNNLRRSNSYKETDYITEEIDENNELSDEIYEEPEMDNSTYEDEYNIDNDEYHYEIDETSDA